MMILMIEKIKQLVLDLGETFKPLAWKCVTAESCTGGGLAYWITAVPGSSLWFDRGFVTYSNSSKEELLGVSGQTLKQLGAVSEEVAREMAENALKRSEAEISVAITGIAGPEGGAPDKPVGSVWIAFAGMHFKTEATLFVFQGDRQQIRLQTIVEALKGLIRLAK